jgi:hypothetical protein
MTMYIRNRKTTGGRHNRPLRNRRNTLKFVGGTGIDE